MTRFAVSPAVVPAVDSGGHARPRSDPTPWRRRVRRRHPGPGELRLPGRGAGRQRVDIVAPETIDLPEARRLRFVVQSTGQTRDALPGRDELSCTGKVRHAPPSRAWRGPRQRAGTSGIELVHPGGLQYGLELVIPVLSRVWRSGEHQSLR